MDISVITLPERGEQGRPQLSEILLPCVGVAHFQLEELCAGDVNTFGIIIVVVNPIPLLEAS